MNEQKQIAKEYLELAKNDLESARLLYNANIYNNSIFELQQAVEKATKCFVLIMEINNESFFKLSEMKNHDSLKFLMEVIERYIKFVDERYNKKDDFAENIKKGIKNILNEQKDKINNINGKENKEEIVHQLSLILQIKDANIINISKEDMVFILKENYKINLSNEEINKRYNELKKNINNLDFLRLLNKVFMPLSLLGAITFRHESSARYPFDYIDNNANIIFNIKPEEYKQGLGVVDTFQDMEELLKSVIIKLEEELK